MEPRASCRCPGRAVQACPRVLGIRKVAPAAVADGAAAAARLLGACNLGEARGTQEWGMTFAPPLNYHCRRRCLVRAFPYVVAYWIAVDRGWKNPRSRRFGGGAEVS